MLIGLIIGAIILLILIGVLILIILRNLWEKNRQYHSLVVVKGGKNVGSRTQTGKELLYGEYSNAGTLFVNVNVSVEERQTSGCCLRLTRQGTRQQYAARFSDLLVVGRNPGTGNVLKVEGEGISRMHCRFGISEGYVYVEDLNSRYHTYLNGRDLAFGAMYVNPGDEIVLGQIPFRIYYEMQ